MQNRLKSILSQSTVYGIGNILIQGINFLLIPVYTRFLSPADYGILSIIGTYSAILLIFVKFGLDAALTRHYYDYLDDDAARRKYYGTVWIFLTGTALLITLIINWQGENLFSWIVRGIAFNPYGRIATWLAFVGTAAIIPLTLFRVREKPFQYITVSLVRFLISSSLIILFVVGLNRGAKGSLQGQLIAESILFIPLSLITLRNIKLSFNWDQLRSSLAFSLPIVPHQLSGWALNMSDRILLNQFVSLDQLGIYDLGYKFGMVMDIVLQSFNLSWSPIFFRMASTEENAPQTISRLTTYYTFGVYILGLSVSLLAGDVIRIIAKPVFFPSVEVVRVVILGFIMHGFYFMSVNQLFYAKKTKHLPIYSGVSAALNIILNLVLIPKFGYMAAAWNTVLGYTVLFILVHRESNKVYPIPLEYQRLGILTLVVVLVFFTASLIQLTNPWLNLISRSLVIFAYPAGLFLFRFFTIREINAIRLLFRRKPV